MKSGVVGPQDAAKPPYAARQQQQDRGFAE